MYKNILVPVDGSEVSAAGVAEAMQLARQLGAKLRFFHVIDLTYLARGGEGASVYADQLTGVTRQEAAKLLAATVRRASDAGIESESNSVEIMTGRPADEIVHEATRARSDLIVMGTHGRRGFQRAMLGSDAEAVLRHAAVPVLLVPTRSK